MFYQIYRSIEYIGLSIICLYPPEDTCLYQLYVTINYMSYQLYVTIEYIGLHNTCSI